MDIVLAQRESLLEGTARYPAPLQLAIRPLSTNFTLYHRSSWVFCFLHTLFSELSAYRTAAG